MITWKKYKYKVEGKKTERRKKTYVRPSYNIRDVYRFYKETLINNSVSKKNNVDLDIFKEIQNTYNKIFAEYVLKGNQIKLPYNLGEIGIRRKKLNIKYVTSNIKALNWQYYNKNNKKKIYHLAEKTDGWLARWYWRKKGVKIGNSRLYSFKPTDTNKKAVSVVMKNKNGYLNYYEGK